MVREVRKHFGVKRVGHAGTLDPFATGLLIVAVGREFTKTLGEMVNMEKEYIGEVCLGTQTDTYDVEGKIVDEKEFVHPTVEQVKRVLAEFKGEVLQVPPKYSAIKLKGVRAYKLSRRGEDVELEPRIVRISEIELLGMTEKGFRIRVVCGKGTYIRSLANDIGIKLGMGAHLHCLIRTRIGHYTIEQSITLEQLQQSISIDK